MVFFSRHFVHLFVHREARAVSGLLKLVKVALNGSKSVVKPLALQSHGDSFCAEWGMAVQRAGQGLVVRAESSVLSGVSK